MIESAALVLNSRVVGAGLGVVSPHLAVKVSRRLPDGSVVFASLVVILVDSLFLLALRLVHRRLELCGCHLSDHVLSMSSDTDIPQMGAGGDTFGDGGLEVTLSERPRGGHGDQRMCPVPASWMLG